MLYCITNSGDSGRPCLVPDLRGRVFVFSLSPLSIMLAEGLSCMAFIVLRYFPSVLILLSVLIITGCCILSKPRLFGAFISHDLCSDLCVSDHLLLTNLVSLRRGLLAMG